jgi:hypothetical protein
MRKAAGILMIIFSVTAISNFMANLIWLSYRDLGSHFRSQYPDFGKPPFHLLLLVVILGAFAITGGVFCLKRKYWTLCFISSLFLHYWMIVSYGFDFLGLSWYLFINRWFMFLTPVAILPLIFICLRKREWEE